MLSPLLHHRVALRAAQSPGAVAVIDGQRHVTYAELEERAGLLAGHLRAQGVGPEGLVGVLLPRGLDLVVALLGIWKAGAAYVPLDTTHPADRVRRLLSDTGASVVVTDAAAAGMLAGAGVRPLIAADALAGPAAAQPEAMPRAEAEGANAAYVLYTSGSTGEPKGVVVTQAGIANHIDWKIRLHGIDEHDRVLQRTPVSFDAAVWEFFAPLVAGATLVMAPAGAERDAKVIAGAVAEYGVTILQLVPSVLRLLIEEPAWEACDSVRLLLCGGEPLHAELLERVRADVWNAYGPTECTVEASAGHHDPLLGGGQVPIGRPVDNVRLLVLDPSGDLAAFGVPGELYVGGAGVARGYLGRPAQTAERFVPDPYGEPGSRLYRTGDRVRWREDGQLEYMGRLDQQIKVDGVRIEPGEIEAALNAHPEVSGAVVSAVRGSDGTVRLAAHVRGAPTPAELRGHLRDRLPAPFVPSVFVRVDTFPLLANGKVDRSALPAPVFDTDGGSYVAPRTAAEETVSRVWAELLGVERVSVHDDFFQLGGHSLLLVRLAERLRAESGGGDSIHIQDLYGAFTVEAQARLLDGTGAAPAPVTPADRTGILPLSFGQERLWFLDRLMPGSAEFTVPLFVRLPGRAGLGAVHEALRALVARHEILRTRYPSVDGEPRQVISTEIACELREAATGDLAAEARAEMGLGFDLAEGPVWRALLIRAEDGDVLLLTLHHLACDGWSAVLLERDFRALYAGEVLPAPALQYADHAVWQRRELTDERMAAGLAAWRTALDGCDPLQLPTDRPRPALRDGRGAVVSFTVPADVADAALAVGREQGATPFMTLAAAYCVLLARHTGQWDLTIGTPVAGRLRPETAEVPGFFLNSLALRSTGAPQETFAEAVARTRAASLFAFAHQDVPFERVVQELERERDLSRTPLYQAAFDLHDQELTGGLSGGADADVMAQAWGVAKTDLTLFLRRHEDGSYIGGIEYATALFDAPTVERLAEHFVRVLARAGADPHRRTGELELLSEAERAQLARWNVTDADWPASHTLRMFEEQATATPDAVAVSFGALLLTYRELDERASRFARGLSGRGVGPGDTVGVLLGRGPDVLAAFLGTWKAGAAYVPVDPDFPADRIAYMLADSRATAVISESSFEAVLGEVWQGALVLTHEVAGEDPASLDVAADPEATAYVIYTSGSTGRPKGVQVPHRGLAGHLRWAVRDLASHGSTGAPVFSSTAFDLVVPNLYAPLLCGQTVHLLPRDLPVTDLGRTLAEAGPFSFIKLTPGHLELLTHQLSTEQAASLASVLVIAGEGLPTRLAEHWRGILGDGRLINEYGPTEASVGSTIHPVTGEQSGEIVPIGRPLPGVTTHVLDAELRQLPVGVTGELYVAGAGLAHGYVDQPALTAERFVPNPYGEPGSRLYRTGDLARLLPGGAVDFLGRIDGQVKIRGYRVETGEIAAVLGTHPDVREAVVVVDESAAGDKRLVAYCVPAGGGLPAAAVLSAHCAQRMSDYMVPLLFMEIDAVPLNRNGKVDRRALPAPDLSSVVAAAGHRAPRDPVETRINEIWTALLGVDAGIHGNFFQMGGNSLLAVRLISRIQDEFDVDLPVRAVFQGPTVAEQAAAVEEQIRAEIAAMSDAELVADATQLKGYES
ncbi:amino acid adenylation domain-containing protein [Streptomyces goshikiensis]|uniref:amino acid adenylation domain-containing protein n=1 Tax=Streptomyces goshikiensis TaxID=1942 RepID=UPI0036BED4B7